jgi:hyaluronate lyase
MNFPTPRCLLLTAALCILALCAIPTVRADHRVVVDNDDTNAVTRTGNWSTVPATAQSFSTTHLSDQNTGKGSKSVRFSAPIAFSGIYDIYLWWPASATNAASVPVDIHFTGGSNPSGGDDLVTVNQTTSGGQWVRLGTYPLRAGVPATVTVRNDGTTGTVAADAVLF